MMQGIFLESLRGAIVKILRLIIYAFIILLVFYIIGLINQNKQDNQVNKERSNINVNDIEEKF